MLRSLIGLSKRSLHHLLSLENKLTRPGSEKPGPRIGASYTRKYFSYLVNKGKTPPAGTVADNFNSGVFIIKPDKEEFLYLINLKLSNRVKARESPPGEQSWINEVYLYEKFDIGFEYNVRNGVVDKVCLFYTQMTITTLSNQYFP